MLSSHFSKHCPGTGALCGMVEASAVKQNSFLWSGTVFCFKVAELKQHSIKYSLNKFHFLLEGLNN